MTNNLPYPIGLTQEFSKACMSNQQDNTFAMQLGIAACFLLFAFLMLAFVGVILAILALGYFILTYWAKVYRYEGKKPLLWLLGITFLVMLPIGLWLSAPVATALNYEIRIKGDDRLHLAFVMVILFAAPIAAPTVLYWLYRLIRPISNVRIAFVEHYREQYAEHEITKKQRDVFLEGIISSSDDRLEQLLIDMKKKTQPQPWGTENSSFDVPPQDER